MPIVSYTIYVIDTYYITHLFSKIAKLKLTIHTYQGYYGMRMFNWLVQNFRKSKYPGTKKKVN
jgi:hypothetical protein